MSNLTEIDDPGLTWPELSRGRLVKRYKRFLADVKLDDNTVVTAHCANSGRMTTCSQPGRPVYLSYHDNPRRKLKYTWELIRMPNAWVGVNTLVPNRLVAQTVENGNLPHLNGYDKVTREVRIDSHTRLDLQLSGKGRRDCYIEVKNCTLVEDGRAMFPDAPTVRGQKHLTVLEQAHRPLQSPAYSPLIPCSATSNSAGPMSCAALKPAKSNFCNKSIKAKRHGAGWDNDHSLKVLSA